MEISESFESAQGDIEQRWLPATPWRENLHETNIRIHPDVYSLPTEEGRREASILMPSGICVDFVAVDSGELHVEDES